MPEGSAAAPANLTQALDQLGDALSRDDVQPEDEEGAAPISVDAELVDDNAADTLHRAYCMHLALVEWQQRAHENEPDEDEAFGQYLLGRTVSAMLRVVKEQMSAEYREQRDQHRAECADLSRQLARALEKLERLKAEHA